jgi:hypothetical protein
MGFPVSPLLTDICDYDENMKNLHYFTGTLASLNHMQGESSL